MRREFLILLGALLVLGGLVHIIPPAKGQYFPPALPGTFGDIATPSVAPPAGATRVYTKSGTVCAFSPLSVETCTGSGGGGSSIVVYQSAMLGSAQAVAAPANVRSGDSLIVGICSNTATAVTDTLLTSFSKVASIAGGNGNLTSIFSGKATSSGADTITVTGTVGNCSDVGFIEVSGLTGSAEANGTANAQTASVTSLTAGAFIVAAQSAFSNATSLGAQAPLQPFGTTAAAGTTGLQSLNVNGNGALTMGYYIAGAAGAYPATILSTQTGQTALVVASFPHS